MGRFAAVGVALLGAVLGTGCGVRGPARVIVLGLDGLDRRAVDRMLAEGKLPSFARLRQEGAYARLVTSQPPPDDAALWTTIATGNPGSSAAVGPGGLTVSEGGARQGKALWDLLSDAGRKVAVVGWPVSTSDEPSRGLFVSARAWEALVSLDPGGGGVEGLTHPADLVSRIRPLIRRPEELAAGGQPALGSDLAPVRRALAASESYGAIALELWRSERPDFLLLYVQATDAASHLGGPLSGRPAASGAAEEVGRVLEGTYRSADRLLGQLLAAMNRNTTLVVVSDHGFERAAEGVVSLFGNRVRRAGRLGGPTPQDIAPTVLALMRVVPAVALPGRALTEALDIEDPARRAREARSGSPKAGEREQADRSFRAGRFEEAAVVYQRLVEQHPADPSLRASLAGALGAGSRYEDALKQLEVAIRLAPLDPTSRHNRGAVFERLGRPKEAIEQYRAAVRYSPGYEPSRRALLRLTGSEEPDPPRTAEERRARELADEASEAARQKDYPRARDLLDQAQRLAPRYALVYQYRSNVLYLMGDSAAAARALESALALDPDNALYARNLQGLRQRGRPERP